jgi:DNA-nicking Smr family endonuclease
MDMDGPALGPDSEKEARVLSAELRDQSDTIPTLDLHGFTAEDAISEINDFVSHQIFAGEASCRIVHGKGKGIIERITKEEIGKLAARKLIASSFSSRRYPEVAIVMVFT